jgi:hypothetical protein
MMRRAERVVMAQGATPAIAEAVLETLLTTLTRSNA